MSKKKIVILGGGVGALTAAYYLTDKDGWQDEYDITLYQLGWRLGGKGASSRDPDKGYRIEEHGLHVWFGFYENAFATLRKCYAQLDRPAGTPLATIEEAFTSRWLMSMQENYQDEWSVWPIPFPRKNSKPGIGHPDYLIWEVLGDALEFLVDHLAEWVDGVEKKRHPKRNCLEKLKALLCKSTASTESVALRLALKLVRDLPSDHKKHSRKQHHLIRKLIKEFRDWMRHEVEHLIMKDTFLRRLWYITDMLTSVIIGCFDDDVFNKGLISIDDQEFRQWIRKHGATEGTANSTPIRALYDCMFAYRDGDLEKPDFAAGAALGCYLRIGLLYRGDVLYEMNAGMGDVVVMPIYQLLAKRGVKFEFFSEVKKLELDETNKRIASVKIGRQVTLKNGSYEPTAWCEALKMDYWPPHPLYDQIVQGEELKNKHVNLESHWADWQNVEEYDVKIGPEDQVVLGIAKGGLDEIVEPLCVNDAWKRMMEELPSTQTQSMQLWMTESTTDLGWKEYKDAPATMVAGPEPQDVWADMSHLLPMEAWPPADAPKSLQYFCGPMKGNYLAKPATDHAVPDEAYTQVRNTAIRWLTSYADVIWPSSNAPDSFNWELLFDTGEAEGVGRIDSQWLHANIDPTERYVTAPAGANLTRLPSDDTGFENLLLAGDWSRTPINAGCVEGAVMSAMMASRKLCGHPKRIVGEHFLQS